MRSHPLRWVAITFFVLSSTLNYLDRNLSGVLAPLIKREFSLNNQQIGWLISVFSIAYAAASLPAGWLLDRLGVNRAISLAVGLWSLTCAGLGLVQSVGAMAVFRGLLGAGEAASVPGFAKVNGEYLLPEERALGAAVNGIGISVGATLAAFSIGFAATYGWRRPFLISGALGLLWIPLWAVVSRWIPRQAVTGGSFQQNSRPGLALLREPSLLILLVANLLWMLGFSLWSNWITIYLVEVYRIPLAETKGLVWIPPVVSNLGGFFGGWLSLVWVRRNVPVVLARKRAVWVSAFGCLAALGLLFAPTPAWATFFIAGSFFFVLSGSVNLYALPIDLFGASRAGLAVSAMTCAYGILQAVISPVIGWMGDRHLYHQAIWLVALVPAVASAVLASLPTQKQADLLADKVLPATAGSR